MYNNGSWRVNGKWWLIRIMAWGYVDYYGSFNIKMPSYQYMDSHYKDKTVLSL